MQTIGSKLNVVYCVTDADIEAWYSAFHDSLYAFKKGKQRVPVSTNNVH